MTVDSGLSPNRSHCVLFLGKTIIDTMPTVLPNPSRKRSFSKAPFKSEEFENAGLRLGGSRKRWFTTIKWFRDRVFPFKNTNSKWPIIVAFLHVNFCSGLVWRESAFRVKSPFPNSCSVVWTVPVVYWNKYVQANCRTIRKIHLGFLEWNGF